MATSSLGMKTYTSQGDGATVSKLPEDFNIYLDSIRKMDEFRAVQYATKLATWDKKSLSAFISI